MSAPDKNGELHWFKSSYSTANGNCVEVAFAHGVVAMRDSKDPAGPLLRFPADAWTDFIRCVRSGEFAVG